jgi:DNA ligase D-like protein (predicted ligase)/DNA ligase D-like protein (predicted 3'-phosphoesterase)
MSRHIYKPMLAKVAEEPFSGKDWIFEVKWDGFRAIAYVEQHFSLKSRNEKELKQNFPELAQLTKLGSNIVVDGEIVVMKEGKPDFQSLLERGKAASTVEIERESNTAPAVYIVFDILEKDGKSLTKLPLTERKAILQDSLKEGTNVLLCDFIEEKGEAYFKSVLEKGLEGVVAKRRDSMYEEGLRTGSWVKIKKLKTCDCVIFGYTKGTESRGATFGALLLGVYDKGKPVYLGKVGTGFTQEMIRTLTGKFEKIKTEAVPFKPEAGDKVTWLQPKLVCEVAYQVLTRDIRLRMARFKRLRDDKPPEQCTLDQVIEVKKTGTETKDKEKSQKDAAESEPEKLSEYAKKRHFEETPEPKAEAEKKGDKLIYVIQEHHARALHYDFRLEKDGVLKSWAVPKGMPEADEKRLAVETEDHPYEYASFEGTIPKGQYGAGTVKIWDKGTYVPKFWENDKIEVTLDGKQLKGRYVLVRLKRAGDKDWLLLKGKE